MYIVINSCNINLLKNIEEFAIDLGRSLMSIVNNEKIIVIKDENILDYGDRYDTLLYKCGSIGNKINVYNDNTKDRNFFGLYLDSNRYVENTLTDEDKSNIRDYINKQIIKIKE